MLRSENIYLKTAIKISNYFRTIYNMKSYTTSDICLKLNSNFKLLYSLKCTYFNAWIYAHGVIHLCIYSSYKAIAMLSSWTSSAGLGIITLVGFMISSIFFALGRTKYFSPKKVFDVCKAFSVQWVLQCFFPISLGGKSSNPRNLTKLYRLFGFQCPYSYQNVVVCHARIMGFDQSLLVTGWYCFVVFCSRPLLNLGWTKTFLQPLKTKIQK